MKNFFNKKKVLITGATGLVGGHVAEQLLKAGAKLYTLSRKPNKNSYFFKKKLNSKAANFTCDILDLRRLQKIILENKIEYIFHLAAQLKLVSLYQTFGFNTMGTNNILEACRHSKHTKGIVLASSNRAAYVELGLSSADMQKLAANTYDVSKIASELIAKNYAKAYNLPTIICRFGNVYGPGDLQKRIIPTLIKCAEEKKNFAITVKPSRRNYVYATDIAEGLLKAAESMKRLGSKDINFETADNYTVEEMIKKSHSVLGLEVPNTVLPNRAKEIELKKLTTNLASRLIGWKPKVKMNTGLKLTYNWYKQA